MPTLNQFAVVTCASSGIGYDLSKQALTRFDLLVAAEDGHIQAVAKELNSLGVSAQAA